MTVHDAELAPLVDAVQLFPQRGVPQIVEVQAADAVRPVLLRVGVDGRHGGQVLPDADGVRRGDEMLDFVSVFHG